MDWFSKPLEQSSQSKPEQPGDKASDETKKAEQEAKERVMRELQKKREEIQEAKEREAQKREAERQEVEKREAERKEAERRKQAERLEAERKERETREAEKREAERIETERKEAERRAAEEREAAKKEKEKRDHDMAKRIAAEIKAGQRDIAKLRESERQIQERDSALKQSIEQEILAKRKALHDEKAVPSSSKGKPKARKMSPSNEGLLTVEELLGDFEQPTIRKEPPKPEPPKKPAINEDELLLNAARMVAHQLSQNRLFDRAPAPVSPHLGASVSSTRSYSPYHGPSRPRSLSSTLEGDRAVVNGYEVALAPSTPGLGRSLSRAEQRIRLTGAKGLAYKPVTPLLRSTSTKEEPKRKPKRLKTDGNKSPSKSSVL